MNSVCYSVGCRLISLLLSLVVLFTLGCSGSGEDPVKNNREEPKLVGNMVGPYDSYRIKFAIPLNTEEGLRRSGYVAWFKNTGNEDTYPAYLVSAEKAPEGMITLSKENVKQFIAELSGGKNIKAYQQAKLGNYICVRYSRIIRTQSDEYDCFQYITVQNGRIYRFEVRMYSRSMEVDFIKTLEQMVKSAQFGNFKNESYSADEEGFTDFKSSDFESPNLESPNLESSEAPVKPEENVSPNVEGDDSI